MPIQLNLLEKAAFLTLNQAPGAVLDLWSAVAFRALVAAVRLDVFENLADELMSSEELAFRLNSETHAMEILLQALVPTGYLYEEDGKFLNTAMTNKWLTSGGKANFSPYIRFWGTMLEGIFLDLENTIRNGEPQVNLYEWIEQHPETSRDFQEGMIALAVLTGDELISKLNLPPTTRRVIDVGGGHAEFSIRVCRQYPQVSATVFDTPEPLVTGKKAIAASGLNDRIDVQPGNFLVDDLGSEFDAGMLINILHGFSPDQNQMIIKKVTSALNAGGRIIIVEQLSDGKASSGSDAINQLLGLTYLHTLGGRVYSFVDIAGWLEGAGMSGVKKTSLSRAPGSGLIVGTK